jgi:hypothetical protein
MATHTDYRGCSEHALWISRCRPTKPLSAGTDATVPACFNLCCTKATQHRDNDYAESPQVMLWTAPSTGAEAPTKRLPMRRPRFGGSHMKTVTTIGLDIAKSVFQVHGIDAAGKVVIRKQLKRGRVLPFFMKLPPCLVGIEACASSHYWAAGLREAVRQTPEERRGRRRSDLRSRAAAQYALCADQIS